VTLRVYVFSDSVERRTLTWALTMVRKLDFLEGRLNLDEGGVG
jgi:hypothetical protein